MMLMIAKIHDCQRPQLPDFWLFEPGGSKSLHSLKKNCEFISWFMQKCERSLCAVWVENCELLSGGTIQELNIDEQFSETRVEKWTPKTTSLTAKCSWAFRGCHSHRLHSHGCNRRVKTLTSSFWSLDCWQEPITRVKGSCCWPHWFRGNI